MSQSVLGDLHGGWSGQWWLSTAQLRNSSTSDLMDRCPIAGLLNEMWTAGFSTIWWRDTLLLLAARLLGALQLRVHNLRLTGNVGGLRLTTRPLRHNTAMLRCESFDGEVEVTAPGCGPAALWVSTRAAGA